LYSHFTIAKKYLHYWITSSSGKGHGVHSPFVFDFIIHVLNDKKKKPVYQKVEWIRKSLLQNKEDIDVEDFGAGSGIIKSKKRRIDKIAASSLKSKKYAQLLYRIVCYYKPLQLIELGTSFGMTTSYLALANLKSTVFTFEGSAAIAKIAQANFDLLSIKNIELIQGDFATTLPLFIRQQKHIDLAYIDGNHRKLPTIDYFNELLKLSDENSVFIFDDIHWSKEMELAWEAIKQHPSVTLSIDLFFIGLIFFKKDFKEKQHFSIQF